MFSDNSALFSSILEKASPIIEEAKRLGKFSLSKTEKKISLTYKSNDGEYDEVLNVYFDGEVEIKGTKFYSTAEGVEFLYQWVQDIEIWCMKMRRESIDFSGPKELGIQRIQEIAKATGVL